MSVGGWADRYRQGDRERVWAELRRLGSDVRDPSVLTEAQAVCDEMVLRVRFNIELLVNRLQSQGLRCTTDVRHSLKGLCPCLHDQPIPMSSRLMP